MAGTSSRRSGRGSRTGTMRLRARRRGFAPRSGRRLRRPRWLPYPHRPGAEKCQHFMSHGRCKFGETCRYDHPPGTTPTHGVSENGGLTTENDRVLPGNQAMTGGLPVIAGVADCPFFMKTGMCKYGAKCKYNHPLEKQVGTSESTVKMPVSNKPPEMRSMMPAGAGAPQVALRPGSVVGPWEVHQNEMGQLYYFNVLSQQSTWQTPPELMTPSYGYAQPMGMPFNPAYAAYGMPAMGGYGAPGGYPQGAAAGYPQAVASGGPGGLKPGMPDCTFYIKMGKCKYGDACKFNHPIDGRPSGTTFVGLGNIEGNYPVRPGVPNCGFYMRTGECKYGPECKYNHPSKEEREAIRIAEGNPPFGGSSSSAPHAGQTASAYLAPTGYSYA
ncbi:hypothetical protein T484DRAFT_2258074 [Baffinella frigidus]|nr:hypothetical protein T484DRAFT_2258074 [Cryptophyta sp. CCMP2293]